MLAARASGSAVCSTVPWQRPGLGKAEEAQPQVPGSVLRHQHVHTQNSSLMHFPTALKGITHSHLNILQECQDTGPIEKSPAALRDATTRQRGWVVGLGHSAITMVEGALNTGSCPEQPRCHNSWSVEAW